VWEAAAPRRWHNNLDLQLFLRELGGDIFEDLQDAAIAN